MAFWRHVFRPSEDINYIDRHGDIFETRIGFFSPELQHRDSPMIYILSRIARNTVGNPCGSEDSPTTAMVRAFSGFPDLIFGSNVLLFVAKWQEPIRSQTGYFLQGSRLFERWVARYDHHIFPL
jgi:hypothetical protein